MDQQLELLKKLLTFYKGRYNGVELENKFNDACEDLISTGDLNNIQYIKFCTENDIEPKTKKVEKKISKTKSNDSWGSSRNYDPCGGGYRSYGSSHC